MEFWNNRKKNNNSNTRFCIFSKLPFPRSVRKTNLHINGKFSPYSAGPEMELRFLAMGMCSGLFF
ncbi:hypothetical protein EHQ43_07625 [Leptospira bouyouniensis]|uniref:Uncharacterized protein n=1 Tax=Leptospira bouyouniensis TaxID=2484911 RepID=A0A7I0HTX9_9LEPT|nr:hypothetical protein EHQ10_14225 [Leptospira bouyouniensis]TGL07276.1 hypothetical protein EHQ43_07625 [Leptospira bouyouniensis]TGM79632.1 hypothetical protein EHQ99_07765 [Leptospira bouyouniensis]